MLHSLFRACESFTFVTANWGQLDVTLPRTQNLVVTVLVGSKFGVGWVTTFNHKHYMTLQPLIAGSVLFPGKFSLLISQWGRPGGYCVCCLINRWNQIYVYQPEMKRIFLGQSPCVYRRHTWANTHSTGWWSELNNWDEHRNSKLRLTTGINLKIGCTKILSKKFKWIIWHIKTYLWLSVW